MDSVKDKVVFITGASGGIGKATAMRFAACGSKLALTGRDLAKLQKTAELCQAEGLTQDKIFLDTGDVSNEEDVNRIVDAAVKKLGGIDILINNAGSVINGTFEKTSNADLDFMYNIHVKSVFMVTRRALPSLIQNKGTIVNVSSIAGSRPIHYCFNYSVAKATINQFTQTLAIELAPKGVRVNAVAPGVIDTDIFIRPGGHVSDKPEQLPQFYAQMATAHPMQRIGQPDEVAQTILYLASNQSSFTTGAIIPIDGGRHGTCSAPAMLS